MMLRASLLLFVRLGAIFLLSCSIVFAGTGYLPSGFQRVPQIAKNSLVFDTLSENVLVFYYPTQPEELYFRRNIGELFSSYESAVWKLRYEHHRLVRRDEIGSEILATQVKKRTVGRVCATNNLQFDSPTDYLGGRVAEIHKTGDAESLTKGGPLSVSRQKIRVMMLVEQQPSAFSINDVIGTSSRSISSFPSCGYRITLNRSLSPHANALATNCFQRAIQKTSLQCSYDNQQETENPVGMVAEILPERDGRKFADFYGLLCILSFYCIAGVLIFAGCISICERRGLRGRGWFLVGCGIALDICATLSGLFGRLPWNWGG
jgi:hypothetical protein